jgi:serine protease SohB
VDYKEYTAGEFKRTVSLFGEITEKGEEKFRHQLENTHVLFKNFVHRFRPHLDMHQVATGEYWYGEQALGLGLIDQIKTSDDYLLSFSESHQIVKVEHLQKGSISDRITGILGKSLHRAGSSLLQELEARKWL